MSPRSTFCFRELKHRNRESAHGAMGFGRTARCIRVVGERDAMEFQKTFYEMFSVARKREKSLLAPGDASSVGLDGPPYELFVLRDETY